MRNENLTATIMVALTVILCLIEVNLINNIVIFGLICPVLFLLYKKIQDSYYWGSYTGCSIEQEEFEVADVMCMQCSNRWEIIGPCHHVLCESCGSSSVIYVPVGSFCD